VSGPDYFSIQIDVSNFRPEELKVSVIEHQVVIEGKHDEKSDSFGQVKNLTHFRDTFYRLSVTLFENTTYRIL
jgi:HSP20 family molecular chaperone IbpA